MSAVWRRGLVVAVIATAVGAVAGCAGSVSRSDGASAPAIDTATSAGTFPASPRIHESLIGRAVEVEEFTSGIDDSAPCGVVGCGRLVAEAVVECLRARGIVATVAAPHARAPHDARLEGDLIELDAGNRAARYFIGAGASRVAIRTRVRDASGRSIADFLVERQRTSGKFGGSSPSLLQATLRDAAEDVADRVATGRY